MSKAKTLTEEERETSGGTLAVILLCVIIIWATGGWLVDSNDTVNRGTFGDMFGAVNALFSGLAFATLIYTVFLQRRELQLQRQELAETRKELQRSASAQEASEAALRIQAQASAQSAHLAAINNLLPIYKAKLDRMIEQRLYFAEPWKSEYEFCKEREKALMEMLESIYLKINQEHEAQRQSDSRIASGQPPKNNL